MFILVQTAQKLVAIHFSGCQRILTFCPVTGSICEDVCSIPVCDQVDVLGVVYQVDIIWCQCEDYHVQPTRLSVAEAEAVSTHARKAPL